LREVASIGKYKTFNFVEYGQNRASTTLETDMKYQLFEQYGKEPNGYSWEKFSKYISKEIYQI
jgi:hypothetical protein